MNPTDTFATGVGEQLGWGVLVIVLGWIALVVAEEIRRLANPVNDVVPDGEMPALKDWLEKNAPASSGGTSSRTTQQTLDLSDVVLEPVINSLQLWRAYTWSTGQIVEEVPSMLWAKNYVASVVVQLASFPRLYSEWSNYESCVVDEVMLGPEDTSLGPVDSDGTPAFPSGPPKQVVLECDKVLETHGVSLVARPRQGAKDEIVGAATLIVKRLPEACHIEDDGEECSVVCNVDWSVVAAADGLEAVGYLEALAVCQEWRGSGLADKLLSFVEGKTQTWGLRLLALHVHRDNWTALRFYSKRGFDITSDWMGWGESFFLLIKPLD